MLTSREDIAQAVEVALGDQINSDDRKPQTVSDAKVERQLLLLERTLRELDPALSVEEILEVLDFD